MPALFFLAGSFADRFPGRFTVRGDLCWLVSFERFGV